MNATARYPAAVLTTLRRLNSPQIPLTRSPMPPSPDNGASIAGSVSRRPYLKTTRIAAALPDAISWTESGSP